MVAQSEGCGGDRSDSFQGRASLWGTTLKLMAFKLVGHMAHEFYLKEVVLKTNSCWRGGFVGKCLTDKNKDLSLDPQDPTKDGHSSTCL